jgi:hypothetical protein
LINKVISKVIFNGGFIKVWKEVKKAFFFKGITFKEPFGSLVKAKDF